MTKTESHTVNTTPKGKCWLPCERCDNETQHEVRVSTEIHDQSDNGDVHVGQSFEVVRCCGCQWLSFRQTSWCSEDRDETGELEVQEELYPSRLSGKKRLQDDHYLPTKVCRIYREAHFAMTNRQAILAGIGIRALVEAVCSEERAKGNLAKKINGLVHLNKLTQAGADILHGTRLLGNKAAHEVEPPSERELLAAMQVAEHLLNTVYLLPHTARALPRMPKVAPTVQPTAPKATAKKKAVLTKATAKNKVASKKKAVLTKATAKKKAVPKKKAVLTKATAKKKAVPKKRSPARK